MAATETTCSECCVVAAEVSKGFVSLLITFPLSSLFLSHPLSSSLTPSLPLSPPSQLSNNHLSGEVPASVALMPRLQRLELGDNQLTGLSHAFTQTTAMAYVEELRYMITFSVATYIYTETLRNDVLHTET